MTPCKNASLTWSSGFQEHTGATFRSAQIAKNSCIFVHKGSYRVYLGPEDWHSMKGGLCWFSLTDWTDTDPLVLQWISKGSPVFLFNCKSTPSHDGQSTILQCRSSDTGTRTVCVIGAWLKTSLFMHLPAVYCCRHHAETAWHLQGRK